MSKSDEVLQSFAREMGTFCVNFLSGLPDRADKAYPFHQRVIRPLIEKATACRVFRVEPSTPLERVLRKIAQPKGNNWDLDLTKECVKGKAPLWNAYCEHFGIAIVTDVAVDDLAPIFARGGRPHVWKSMSQLQEGSSKAAVTFCQKAAKDGSISFLLSGTNGPEWADVFAPARHLSALWAIARKHGKAKLSLP